jgi:hypothetical protein
MCAASHQRIRVAIETASEPRVFFIIDNERGSSNKLIPMVF